MAEPLHEKEGLTNDASKSSAGSGLILSPSPTGDTPPAAVTVRATGTPLYTDSQSPLDTPQPVSKPQIAKHRAEQASNGIGLASERILPDIISPSSQPPKPMPPQSASASPHSPRRHSRIPSTGSRALVMDIAQALQRAQLPPEADIAAKCSIAPQRVKRHSPTTEQRKSSYDKYIELSMPPLVEEHALPERIVSLEPAALIRETLADPTSRESEMSDATRPGRRDDIFVEICKWDNRSLCSASEHEPSPR
jgi:hypothetical protein